MSANFIYGPTCRSHLVRRYTICWMGSALLKLSEQERRSCGVGTGAQAFAATMKSALGQSLRVLCKHQETVICLLPAPRDCALQGGPALSGSDWRYSGTGLLSTRSGPTRRAR